MTTYLFEQPTQESKSDSVNRVKYDSVTLESRSLVPNDEGGTVPKSRRPR